MPDHDDRKNETSRDVKDDARGDRRTESRDGAEDKNGPGVFVPPPLQFGGALAAGVILDGSTPGWSQLTDPLRLVGILSALAGLVLIVICLGLFKRFRTRPEPWQPDQALIASGVYRLSRNPMYLGMALLCVGISMLFESLIGIGLIGVILVLIDRYVVAKEEAYLARRFGAKFGAYRSKVRRWL